MIFAFQFVAHAPSFGPANNASFMTPTNHLRERFGSPVAPERSTRGGHCDLCLAPIGVSPLCGGPQSRNHLTHRLFLFRGWTTQHTVSQFKSATPQPTNSNATFANTSPTSSSPTPPPFPPAIAPPPGTPHLPTLNPPSLTSVPHTP